MRKTSRLILRSESIRILTDLGVVSGARPTSATFCDCVQVARVATSEQGGDDFPCPGDYTFLCKP